MLPLLCVTVLSFAAELSPLRKLALNTANAAANDIVETNYLLDPNGICVDCTPAQRAAMKKTLLPPKARAALARSKLWIANKALRLDDSAFFDNPLLVKVVGSPRKILSTSLTVAVLLYLMLPLVGLGPWLQITPGRLIAKRFLLFWNLEIVWT
jgi:hypothetical protein